jgi:rRNA maturation protein Rpf1
VIAFTTGRETNQRLNSLVKELAHALPSARVIRRGKSSREELATRLRDGGFSHAAAIYRWHGGPGRVDFFTINQSGLSLFPPHLLLKSVRLGRENANRVKCTATSITRQNEAGAQARRFCSALSEAFELPYVEPQNRTQTRASFHVSQTSDGTVQLALTSHPGQRDVGPKLTISKLMWNLNEKDT